MFIRNKTMGTMKIIKQRICLVIFSFGISLIGIDAIISSAADHKVSSSVLTTAELELETVTILADVSSPLLTHQVQLVIVVPTH